MDIRGAARPALSGLDNKGVENDKRRISDELTKAFGKRPRAQEPSPARVSGGAFGAAPSNELLSSRLSEGPALFYGQLISNMPEPEGIGSGMPGVALQHQERSRGAVPSSTPARADLPAMPPPLHHRDLKSPSIWAVAPSGSPMADGAANQAHDLVRLTSAQGEVLFTRAAITEQDDAIEIASRKERIDGIYSCNFQSCAAIILRSPTHVGLMHTTNSADIQEPLDNCLKEFRKQSPGKIHVTIGCSFEGLRARYTEDLRHLGSLKRFLKDVPPPEHAAVAHEALSRLPAGMTDNQKFSAVLELLVQCQFNPLVAWCADHGVELIQLPHSAVLVPVNGPLNLLEPRLKETPLD